MPRARDATLAAPSRRFPPYRGSARLAPRTPHPARSRAMRRYAQAKEVDEALRSALVLADLKTHENRAPPERLLESNLDAPWLTEARVLEALIEEAQRVQGFLPLRPAWPPLRSSPRSVCAWSPRTPPPASPASAASPTAA